MSIVICPTCKEKVFSQFDTNYLKLFDTCWRCDCIKWDNGEISLEEFEAKEIQASSL